LIDFDTSPLVREGANFGNAAAAPADLDKGECDAAIGKGFNLLS
jgi:hypothetical protein